MLTAHYEFRGSHTKWWAVMPPNGEAVGGIRYDMRTNTYTGVLVSSLGQFNGKVIGTVDGSVELREALNILIEAFKAQL